MSRKMLIDATHPEETRVVVVEGNRVEEFDFETVNKRQLAGNIYLAKVTRVEPSLQAAFVDYGGNRHGFLAFSEIHPDYYQIPVADRKALLEEERAAAQEDASDDDAEASAAGDRKAAPEARTGRADPTATSDDDAESADDAPGGMEVIDLEGEAADGGIDAYESEGADPAASGDDASDEADDDGADASDASDSSNDKGRRRRTRGRRRHRQGDEGDENIESVGREHASDEMPRARRPRRRHYKIQEVIKVRQIILVQVVKEERGNKGAALTTYLSLAGRYCVLMPNTARGGGISRKITNAADRKRLKEIVSGFDVPEGVGLIVRTAGAARTKSEIRRDYEYLIRMWEQIRELTLKSIAPAPIYEEGDLIKRSIRDLYTRDIDEILVEGDAGYRTAKDFMKMIMPSRARQVKKYDEPMRLFARYQVESFLGGMFNPVVQLKSGGYLVIGITEALVAIDVNSGRATKEGSIEETALKTNLEAAEEVARQMRLRDLAGLIVIDFIDMDERRNNSAVEKKLKEALKADRARIQVGRISGFGLLEMSRQRLHPGMLESTTQPCPHCHGTGLIRSDDSMALTILRALEEEGTRRRSKEVLLKAPVDIVNYLFNHKREHIALIEHHYGLAVRMEADAALISPDYEIERFKTATRAVPEADVAEHPVLMGAPVVEDEAPADDVSAEDADDAKKAAHDEAESSSDEDGANRGRRRRRRRRRRGEDRDDQAADRADANEASGKDDEGAEDAADAATDKEDAGRRRSRRGNGGRRGRKDASSRAEEADEVTESASASSSDAGDASAGADDGGAPDKKPESAVSAEEAAPAEAKEAPETTAAAASAANGAAGHVTVEASSVTAGNAGNPLNGQGKPDAEPLAEAGGADEDETPSSAAVEEDDDAAQKKPRRRGWWARRH